ncbi:MAG: 50S ribosomal protein L32, partial [Alphaproteobacteria bacterium]|nr:50S ribosomal protein L32 [Alphaproteobacteria bacterium]
MAVPKRKTSPSVRGMRRSHDAIAIAGVVENQTTGELQYQHHMTKDGYYKGRQVFIKNT